MGPEVRKHPLRRFILAIAVLISSLSQAGVVNFTDHSLQIDGIDQPQLFGAEVQYFRMRGGVGPKVPREKVMALWSKALDQVVAAKMNMISFYIPWDFHEYQEGKFDFDGSVSENGDGIPDYPSRDVKTFIKMALDKGIQHILVRPGPSINAEWGFLGFGAVPLWFHRKYPDSHMQNPQGLRTTLYDYFNPDFRSATKLWFQEVYTQVLKANLGRQRPISFLQLDNETNFQWQSLYNHDFGPRAQMRYREFLKDKYGSLSDLNQATGKNWTSWDDVQPPHQPGLNWVEDQDWYRFCDQSIFQYLQFIRQSWEDVGVHEPEVLFTLAESYNAPDNGLLPNYAFRNHPSTGLMTTNMYPKTYETENTPLLNNPFKVDHDVKAANSANDNYFSRHVEWAMGPEVQAGWWPGIQVSLKSRQQTYLSAIGHGLKAILLYYFIEGENWQNDWIVSEIRPFYEALKNSPPYAGTANLPDSFWVELQNQFEKGAFVGVNVRDVYEKGFYRGPELAFDSPLDKDANPRPQFQTLLEIGKKIVQPYGQFLGSARELVDEICLIDDTVSNLPSQVPGLNSILMNGEWSAGLVGWLEHAGINPRIVHWNLNPSESLNSCQILFHQDNGNWGTGLADNLKQQAQRGATVVNIGGASLVSHWGLAVQAQVQASAMAKIPVHLGSGADLFVPGTPLITFDLEDGLNCNTLLQWQDKPVGLTCKVGQGALIQVGGAVHAFLNSSDYQQLTDLPARRELLHEILQTQSLQTHLFIKEATFLSAFSRQGQDGRIWVTVKNGGKQASSAHILFPELTAGRKYSVRNVLQGDKPLTHLGRELMKSGLLVKLPPEDSAVFMLTAQ